ncbi:MAG: hypothetical protein PHU25_09280 [Deltaproteobacteria bacterium]|nr:hypothetical protein [Deltaproteobacteria bacterium]
MHVEKMIPCSCARCGDPAIAELAGFPYCKECLIIVLAATGDRNLVGEVKKFPGSECQARYACNVALYLMIAANCKPTAMFDAPTSTAPLD